MAAEIEMNYCMFQCVGLFLRALPPWNSSFLMGQGGRVAFSSLSPPLPSQVPVKGITGGSLGSPCRKGRSTSPSRSVTLSHRLSAPAILPLHRGARVSRALYFLFLGHPQPRPHQKHEMQEDAVCYVPFSIRLYTVARQCFFLGHAGPLLPPP
jgi:hypothetical protein